MRLFIPAVLSISLTAWAAAAQQEPAAPSLLAQQAPAQATAKESPALTPQRQGDIKFVSGGSGEEERVALRSVAAEYNMRLLFAVAGSGEYLANVAVTLVDAHDTTVLDTVSDGPLFYAHVPPGRYRITVTGAGQSQTRTLDVAASGAASQAFYWRQAG